MKRRNFLTLSIKAAMAAGYTSAIPTSLLLTHNAHAALAAAGLSDPAMQLLFTNSAPNAMAASFKYVPTPGPNGDSIKIYAGQAVQMTGLVGPDGTTAVPTTIWGYGGHRKTPTWPGMTLERHVNDAPLMVKWRNQLVDRETGKGAATGGPFLSSKFSVTRFTSCPFIL